MAADAVLDCQMDQNDAGAANVREYLTELLRRVWVEGEGFSGKRPFGNSSWEFEVYTALVKAGLIEGKFDEDGYVEEMDTSEGDKLVLAAIDRLGTA